jgi:hypothetical protein
VSPLSFLLLHVSLPSSVLFYHVECVTSINHLWIPHAIKPHAVLEFSFGPDTPMARRLPGLLAHQSSAGKKPS